MSNGINFAATLENPPADLLPATREALDLDAAKERLQVYVGAVARMVEEAEALKIESEQDNERAVALGTSAKKLFNQIEDKRKAIVNEPNDFVKSVNGFCKVFSDKLKLVEDGMKRKISQYRAVQEQKRREEEIRLRREAEELQRKLEAEAAEKNRKLQEEALARAKEEAKAKGIPVEEVKAPVVEMIQPVQVCAPVLPKQQSPVRTETGSASARKAWAFELEDINKVPRSYLVLNEKKVRDDVRAGIRNIEGIKIYEETLTTFRTM